MEGYLLTESEFAEVKSAFAANSENLVDARRVHEWLGVKTKFSMWIKKRIRRYEFESNLDYFVVLPNFGKRVEITGAAIAGANLTEYLCTPVMVQHLAMVESTEKGRQVRKYYIDVATRAQELFALQSNLNRLSLLDRQTFDDASAGSRAMLKRKAFLANEAQVFKELIEKAQGNLFLGQEAA